MSHTPPIRPARGPLRWFFERTTWAGLCLPGLGIWVEPAYLAWRPAGFAAPVPGSAADQIIRHETRHWQQAEHMGVLRWYAAYAWGLIRHGYRRHPLELDARAYAAQASPPHG